MVKMQEYSVVWRTESISALAGLLPLLQKYCEHLKREQEYKLWQDGNHAKVIYSTKFFYEKLNYIHQNPVQEMLVEKPEEYLFSSARNYAELPSALDIIIETPELKTYG
jgi:REP element-mobilizing transposase RayT